MEKRILVSIDGSVVSSFILQYIGELFKNRQDISFQLLTIVAAGSLPSEREWLDELDLMSMMDPETGKRYAAAGQYMHMSVKQLQRYGIDPDRISTRVQLSKSGIAKDIMAETRANLYDALLIGRRGLSRLQELIIGSTSAAILEKCRDVPIWLVDSKASSSRFLVPVNGKCHTLRAVDHLCFIMKDNPAAEITLFYSDALLASGKTRDHKYCSEHAIKAWCQLYTDAPDSHFQAPEQLLIENGFPAERIHRLQTSKGLYPSRQIVRQAMIDDYGTIVMGRRSEEARKGIFGSVSGQVVGMAENTAVWLIG